MYRSSNLSLEDEKGENAGETDIAFVGSPVFYGPQVLKQVRAEFGLRAFRFDSLAPANETCRHSPLHLAVVDQAFGDELLELASKDQPVLGNATIALAYRTPAVAREFMQRWTARFERPVGFLPMNVPIEVWLSFMRLLLHCQLVLPDELVSASPQTPAKRQASPATESDTRPTATASMKQLTSREQQVLELIARGESNKRIAAELNITVHTVKLHVHNLVQKLAVPNRTAAVGLYFEHTQDGRPG